MVDAPDHSAPAQLSRSRVLGMPYIVSEINEPFPNDYAAEFIPILAAYGLLQDLGRHLLLLLWRRHTRELAG